MNLGEKLKKTQIQFSFHCKTKPGEAVKVVGSIRELGIAFE